MFRLMKEDIDKGKTKENVVESNDVLAEMCMQMANRLFTVCTVFRDYPLVQYQADSPIAKALAS
jgi:hypothetical protein